MQSNEVPKLRLLGAPHARDHGAQDPGYVLRPFGISTQPEGIVGYTAWHSLRETVQLHWFTARAQHAESIYRAVPEDPYVLTVAAALHRDNRSFCIGNTHQSSRNCAPSAAGIEHIRAKHHAARVEASVVPHRCSGQSDLLLRHILVRAGPQLFGKP